MSTKLIAALCVVIAFLGLGLTAYHYKLAARDAEVARDAAIRDRDAAVEVNIHNDMVMAAEHSDKLRSDKLAADLADEIDAANNTTLALTKTLAELRAKNADVDAYLRQPVPAALRGLYSHPEAAGGH